MAKVTFDGENLLIIVNAGITELDVQIDLYSDWKEWKVLSDNSKYLQAFQAIGGEPIGGGLFVGTTYLMLNGWKIRPDEVNHTLTLFGNLFGEGGAGIIQPTVGAYIVAVQFRNSVLAQGISTSGGVGTPSQVADAVWDAGLAAHNIANTFGSTNQVAGSGLSSTQVAQAVWNANIAAYTLTNSFGEAVGGNIKIDAATAVSLTTTLLKYQRNRTRVDTTAKTLTIYDDDDLTPITVFDLKDTAGSPSITTIAERVPQ